MTTELDKEREAFEAAMNKRGPAYWQTTAWAREAWEIWQLARAERAALSPQPATSDPTDPGYDVEVLREHVRQLVRRVRQLSQPGTSEERRADPRGAGCRDSQP